MANEKDSEKSPAGPAAAIGSPVMDEVAFSRQLRGATRALALALGIPVLVLLALVLYLLRSAGWVDHSDQVIAQAHLIEKQLFRMQASFRGYRLSGDKSFLKGYVEGAQSKGVPKELETLERMVGDNPSQTTNVRDLRACVGVWIDFVEAELSRTRADANRIRDPGFLGNGAVLFGHSGDGVEKLLEGEAVVRKNRARTLRRVVVVVMSAFAIAGLGGIPLLSIWLRRLLRGMKSSYHAAVGEATRRAEELDVTLNSIGDAVVATDVEGRVVFLNPAAESIMGWSLEEAGAKLLTEVFDIVNERTGEPAENPVGRVLRENIVVGLANHTVLRSRDGREIPIEDSAAPIRGPDGSVRGVILVFHDISGKYLADRQLELSESRLLFLNQLNEATRSLTDSRTLRRTSVEMLGRFLRVSGCSYATVDPATGRFSILEEYTEGTATTRGNYEISDFGPRKEGKMRGGKTLIVRNLEGEISHGEGAEAFLDIGIQAIICCPLLKGGRLVAMMAVHQTEPRNWTEAEIALVETVVESTWGMIERNRAETELTVATGRAEKALLEVAEAAERFRLLGEVVSLQVWTADPDGQLDYVNEECLKYFGVEDAGEVLGESWAQFVHPEDLPMAAGSWRHSLSSGERYSVEFRLRLAATGEFRWFLVRAAAMHSPCGDIVKWFGTNTAIHELKTAQANAELASRAKDGFLATLSHELRTPLTPALMTAAALRGDDRLPYEIRGQLAMIERNIALEARLIDDLLDLTSISRGKLQVRAEPCDAHSLIGLAVEIVRSEAATKGLRVECGFTATRSGLMADPARFQQVIWNLLRNAVKFTPSHGLIHIRTLDQSGPGEEQWLRIEIADSGRGIPAGSLEDIFLPFEQGTAAGDHRFGGVGLGLSIAKSVVTLHGGRICATSEGPGLGSTFVVEFPGATDPPTGNNSGKAEREGEEEAVGSTPDSTVGQPPCLRLLLVEDHAATLEALRTLLTKAGHSVTAASTVADALRSAETGEFDLVISDLGLPDGTGAQLMEKLRDAHQLKGVALSGYGMEEDIARCRQSGFVAHLVKPVRFADLQKVLQNITKENPS